MRVTWRRFIFKKSGNIFFFRHINGRYMKFPRQLGCWFLDYSRSDSRSTHLFPAPGGHGLAEGEGFYARRTIYEFGVSFGNSPRNGKPWQGEEIKWSFRRLGKDWWIGNPRKHLDCVLVGHGFLDGQNPGLQLSLVNSWEIYVIIIWMTIIRTMIMIQPHESHEHNNNNDNNNN